MATITLESSLREVTDDEGHALFSASIYDLILVIGSAMDEFLKAKDPATMGGSRLELYKHVANRINEAFSPVEPLTAGAAMNLAEKVEAEKDQLKKTAASLRQPVMPKRTNQELAADLWGDKTSGTIATAKAKPIDPPNSPSPSST